MQLTDSENEREQLRRAVVISLFTWRRAEASDPLDDDERYGWWGDSFPDVTNDRIGSRLYLLRRRTLVQDTLRDAETYAREALQWLVDDGRLVSVTVAAERQGTDRLNLRAVLSEPSGQQHEFSFTDVWQVIHAV